METFYVRDHAGYVTVVESDKYEARNHGLFEFTNGARTVASFPINGVVSVVEADNAFKAIFLNEEQETEETHDVCLDGQFDELFGSEAFFDAVAEIIDNYCCPDDEEEDEAEPESAEDTSEAAEQGAQGPLPILTVLKATHKASGKPCEGFITPEGKFVDFYEGGNAKKGLDMYNSGEKGWLSQNPTEFTFSEVENG
jgi:hypothetical protein